MVEKKETKEYIIDATNKSLGRLATEVASILNAKNDVNFAKNTVGNVLVKVSNPEKVRLTGNKLKDSTHKTYSGYPGGQKTLSLAQVIDKKGHGEIIKHAVLGMLPKNKLQSIKMKNLVIVNNK